MRKAAAVLAASATVLALALAGCSSDESSDNAQTAKDKASAAMSSAAGAAGSAMTSAANAAEGAMSSANAAASTAVSKAKGALDSAKVATFTAAFKLANPDLASGLDDDAIADILAETCAAIDSGKSEQEIVSGLESSAENNGVKATPDQAQQIYNIAKPAC
ncbi:hypothetical protein [Rhodococcus maanshanensis]|uniref:Glutamate transport system substrate-binding protein n=1 Tax=Rhodococcus maanshanensis TaxID=183556 RepID=A0A1H7N0M7_9NOCA|nr:hypothetical protein [Rhodococcus maanshanensis]SEL17040.1 glutamate transport system substrate-binding protein [Rhodococcus maanshanensis]